MQPYLEGVCVIADDTMMLLSPHEICAALQRDELFQQWSLQHPAAYLSHFFCPLNEQVLSLDNWELGYYDPASQKITVFVPLDDKGFEIKPADDVFKQETDVVERLQLTDVTITLDFLFPLIKEQLTLIFPKEQIGNGFLILQTLHGKALYNVTFITRSIQFINMKIGAATGEVESHQAIELVDKQQKGSNGKKL